MQYGYFYNLLECVSGFPAAITVATMKPNRGWKAAPTEHYSQPNSIGYREASLSADNCCAYYNAIYYKIQLKGVILFIGDAFNSTINLFKLWCGGGSHRDLMMKVTLG